MLVGLVVAAVAALLVYLVAAREREGGAGATPTGVVTVSPAVPPLPPKQNLPAIVKTTFARQHPVAGERFSLLVGDIKRDFGCQRHSFAKGGKSLGAFVTDCPFLDEQGYEVIFFYVVLKNETNRPLSFSLRNFVLTARDGSTFGPVNIRSVEGVAATNYIPENGKLPPRARVDGWLTFDARTGGAPPIAARLSYMDRAQTADLLY